ncbi:Nicastrin [Orchesella cincta]|uniref:Nicastrin n=1 Tax=Orchesella cincta TaxID=48709 RepID=A0A1D2MCX0_ORCCI|nr:Nicastrin [Orchesella cincta]
MGWIWEPSRSGFSVMLSGIILWLISSLCLSRADRTFTKVYEPILGTNACFKRLNGTHEIGCRSSSKGDVGILHLIEDKHSINWVLKDGPNPPYIAMLYPIDFTYENIIQFRDSGRVNGVLLLKEKGRNSTSFSKDSTCPNANYGIYNSSSPKHCKNWNPSGNSLLWENLNFPIFYIHSATETDKLLKCFDNFNRPVNGITARGWPLCASQLRSFMLGAVDTPTCLRRSNVFNMNPGAAKVCDPLGDQNIWASLLPHNASSSEPYPNNSLIVIAARIDGASLFDEISPAADSSISGLITVLSIMKHLGDPSIRDQLGSEEEGDNPIKNVYFMLFNGESFGYIGSSRIVYDMGLSNFPFNVSSIRYFIEVNQASVSSSNGSYFLHQSDLSQSKELTDLIEKHKQLLNLKMEVVRPRNEWGLPPSSLQSFLKDRPDLTGIVLTNHKKEYKNKFYNGIFDDKDKISYYYGDRGVYSLQQNVASLAATVSNTVIELLTSSSDLKVTPDPETVDELFHCYLESANCSIFYELTGMKQVPKPYATYVGVATHLTSMSQVCKLVASRYLGYLVENVTESECWKMQKTKGYYWMNESCYDISSINSTEARSPAFLIDGYDWRSGKYSSWTESIWQSFSVRIFIKPSLAHEVITLVSGILMLGLSMLVVGKINEKADIIFESRSEALVC